MMQFRIFIVFTISALTLLWERIWQAFWPVFSLVLAYSSLALLGLWEAMPLVALHLALFSLFLAAAAVFVWHALQNFYPPNVTQIRLRIERYNHLPHRPLETLADRPVSTADEEARGIFLRHQQRMAKEVGKIRAPLPASVVKNDRYALRYWALAIFILSLTVAKSDAPLRLRQAFTPYATLIADQNAGYDLWIEPPEYTHRPTIFLANIKQDIIDVPKDSLLKLRLHGYRFTPKLHYAEKSYALVKVSPHNYTIDMLLDKTGNLRIASLLKTLGAWEIRAAADSAPQINLLRAEPTPSAALKITYKAQDDYGITKMTGSVTHANRPEETVDFSIPPPATGDGEFSYIQDLASHPAAGMEVLLHLEAEDGAGHKTTAIPITVKLPERIFENPVAKRIIEDRKTLLSAPSKQQLETVSKDLAEIAGQPLLYNGNGVTFLAISMAARRLIYDGKPEAVSSVIDILWEVALKLEDGGLSLAKRDLRDALQELAAALNNKSISEAELQEMAQNLQFKMQAYVGALAQALNDRLRAGRKIPMLPSELARKLSAKNVDIGEMLEKMRQLMQSGDRNDMQAMVRALQNNISNLDIQSLDKMQEAQAKALEALQSLEEIIHRQQSLIEATERAENDVPLQAEATEQEKLRQMLNGDLRALTKAGFQPPENFKTADNEMDLSRARLAGQARDESLPHQRRALDALQQGLDQATDAMADALQQSLLSFGFMPSGMPGGGNGTDPLGRSWRNPDNADVKIPDAVEQKRAQEIIRLLRERANEPGRSQVERNYLDRLLKHFQ